MPVIDLISIELAHHRYQVMLGSGALESALPHPALSKTRRYAVLIDANVRRLHWAKISALLADHQVIGEPIDIPQGESAKSFGMLEIVLSRLLDMGLERRDAIIAIGGGVTGDLAGFTAAVYKRGIDVIQIPTTLLAMTDSSVGGKTAINMPQGKNLVGAFHQPALVVADLDFLDTLPKREVLSGYAEIIKAAAIGDKDFFDRLVYSNRDSLSPIHLQAHLKAAIEFKAEIVEADEKEASLRALLNLGHTFGHALESEAAGALLHGEAVAAGMVMAFNYSNHLGLCPAEDTKRLEDYLALIGLETRLSKLAGAPFNAEAMLERMQHDKKNSGGAIRLVLVKGIGQAFIYDQSDTSHLLNFLKDATQ